MLNKLAKSLQRTGNERLRVYLLGMSDSFLEQHGYSRESLQRGVEEWPWSIEAKAAVTNTDAPITLKSKRDDNQKQLHDAMEPLDWVA